MKIELVQFAIETLKITAPSFIAWWLATRTSQKNFDGNRKEMREQLKINRDNNLEVQNKAYKIQYGIDQLQKHAVLVETMLGNWNLAGVYFRSYHFDKADMAEVLESKEVISNFISTSHDFLHHIGVIATIVHAVNPNADDKFRECCTDLEKRLRDMTPAFSAVVHDTNQFFIQSAHPTPQMTSRFLRSMTDNVREYDQQAEELYRSIWSIRNFILEIIDISFKKLI